MIRIINHIKSKAFSVTAVVLCAVAMLACAAVPVSAEPGERDTNAVTVGVPVDRCPMFYLDPDTGDIVGIGVDLMQAAAENTDLKVVFKAIEEESLKEALDNEAYDLIMPFGSAVDSASGKKTIVSENLIQTPFTLVTVGKRKLPVFNDIRVGMLNSQAGVAETVLKMYPGIEIKLFETMPESVDALRKSEVDALLQTSYVWSYVLQKPSYSNLKVQPSAMFSMDFRAGAPDTPEGRELIARIDQGIAEITDTRRQAITLDYSARELYEYDLFDYMYVYGLVIVLGVLLFIALMVIVFQRMAEIRKTQEEQMRQMLDYDPLTGLLNLNGFRKRVEELLRTHPDEAYIISYNNIRDFKFINDSLGRKAGDDLLRFWASKSLEYMTEDEAIGRISGDHYAIFRHIADNEGMMSDEKNIMEPIENFFINQGKNNRVQLCSGIYVLTHEDFKNIDVDHMLDMARNAEKGARESRKVNFAFYNPEQWERGKRVAEVISHFPSAMEAGDIRVWYQPQVDYEAGKIIGAEALCRWEHSTLGWLSPAEFIKILEDEGLIYKLDSYVWESVCKDLHRWNEQGYRRTVSVNVSRDDIREDQNIPKQFHDLIVKYDLTPEQLRIEITETAFEKNPDIIIDYMTKLREMGFQVEMDDFGSGYSSLNMLKEVPLDCIKLDLHFLTESGDQKKSKTILSSMIGMAGALDMKVIAEGVETREQAEFLHDQGCVEMQGYYFFKPMPVEEFENAVNEAQAAPSDR